MDPIRQASKCVIGGNTNTRILIKIVKQKSR